MGAPGGIAQECVEAYVYSTPPLRLLLFRRPPERGRYWVPVSGKVERSDPDFESAVRRELAEETGLLQPRRLWALGWDFVWETEGKENWRLHAFAVEVAPDFVPTLSAEHEASEWVTPEEAVRRLHFEDNRAAAGRLIDLLRPTSPNL